MVERLVCTELCHRLPNKLLAAAHHGQGRSIGRWYTIHPLFSIENFKDAAGLHRAGSDAVFRYTNLELVDRYRLLKAAFGI